MASVWVSAKLQIGLFRESHFSIRTRNLDPTKETNFFAISHIFSSRKSCFESVSILFHTAEPSIFSFFAVKKVSLKIFTLPRTGKACPLRNSRSAESPVRQATKFWHCVTDFKAFQIQTFLGLPFTARVFTSCQPSDGVQVPSGMVERFLEVPHWNLGHIQNTNDLRPSLAFLGLLGLCLESPKSPCFRFIYRTMR